jgi:hypothetical protein
MNEYDGVREVVEAAAREVAIECGRHDPGFAPERLSVETRRFDDDTRCALLVVRLEGNLDWMLRAIFDYDGTYVDSLAGGVSTERGFEDVVRARSADVRLRLRVFRERRARST